ncbi:hypothetical protein LPJ73_001843 [Coemansia sp. RSA 2703]|nr:hypothetical protein LPJ73_001843 [Coemansia sp. RSA 2703]KAJ2371238.1 hypothetical protein IW150_004684 [Coemansia sp. RSA 2607]KAJ2395448.1 hypothetical protein GGI05_001580 [Coemansia sp. RSA 2603]
MSTAIPYRTPTVIRSVDEYNQKLQEFRNNSSSPKYRIEYFHEFVPGDYTGMLSDNSNFANQMKYATIYLSSQPHIAQFVVNNRDGYFAQDLFEIRFRSGVLFYRDNVMIDYMSMLDFDDFRQVVYSLEYATPKHSPKKQRLLREGGITDTGAATGVTKGVNTDHTQGYASQGCNCTIQ